MVVNHGHNIDSRLKHIPGLPVKTALITCPRAQVSGRLPVNHMSRSCRGAPRPENTGWGSHPHTVPWPVTAHLYLPERSLYVHLEL